MIETRWPQLKEEDIESVCDVLRRGNWSRGAIIAEFERRFATFCGSRFALLTHSGTAALELALRSCGIGPGDDVILPGLTWPSTAIAVLDCGANARIADIDPASYAIAVEQVESLITSRTRAVVAVHLYCSCADVVALRALCGRHGLVFIEDAAQALGCRWAGKMLGTFGVAGAFSFHEKKQLPAGEGGCVVTDDENLYDHLLSLRDHGGTTMLRCGSNYRASSITAAVVNRQVDRLDEITRRQDRAAETIGKRVDDTGLARRLVRRKEITVQSQYSLCFRITDDRRRAVQGKILKRLERELALPVSTAYPPLSDATFFNPERERLYDGRIEFGPTPHSAAARDESIRVPHFALLSDEDGIEAIAGAITRALGDGT